MKPRNAELGDYAALGALWRAMDELHARVLPSYFRRAAGPPKSRAEVERILCAPDERLRVIEDGGVVVGLCHVVIYDTPPVPTMQPRRRAHIDSLAVADAVTRRGMGRTLVEDAESWARDRGASELLLTVWSGNEAAEQFYDALGFRPVSRALARPITS